MARTATGQARETDKGVAMFSADQTQDMKDIVRVSGREFAGATNREMRAKAKSWALANLRGSYLNRNTGWNIEVNQLGIKKTTSGEVSEEHLESMRFLPEMIQKSRLVETRPDKDGNPDVKAMHRFEVEVDYDGRRFVATLTIKETTGKKFYVHSLKEIEKPNANDETTGLDSLGYHHPLGSTDIVPQNENGVKPSNEDPDPHATIG